MVKAIWNSEWPGAVGATIACLWEAFLLLGPPTGLVRSDRTSYLSWGLFFILVCGIQSFAALKRKNKTLEKELQGHREARPFLKASRFYQQSISYSFSYGNPPRTQVQVGSSVILEIHNDPSVPTPQANAQDISAAVTFYDSPGQELFSVDGRWSQSTQPSAIQPGVSRASLHSMDIPIGQKRQIDIAFKYPDDSEAYAFGNDSYSYPRYQNPEWKLVGQEFEVRVRVRGTSVDRTWRMRFKNADRELVVSQAPCEEGAKPPEAAIAQVSR